MENKSNEITQEMAKIMRMGCDHIFTTGLKKLIEDDGFKDPDVDEMVHKIAKDMEALSDCAAYDNCSECGLRSECFVLYLAYTLYARGYQKRKWIRVEDRLPEAKPQSDELIICTEDGTVGAGRYCIYKTPDGYEGVFSWMENEGSDFYSLGTDSKVTHWMPLPDLPPQLLKGGR